MGPNFKNDILGPMNLLSASLKRPHKRAQTAKNGFWALLVFGTRKPVELRLILSESPKRKNGSLGSVFASARQQNEKSMEPKS